MIKTSMTREETELLQHLGFNRWVYEAGALLGHSTVTLAQVAKGVTSVDPHCGYPHERPRSTWSSYLFNIRGHRVTPIKSEFQSVVVPVNTQLAWADLTGGRAITEQFLAHTAHVPILAIHDYQRTNCGGATEAIDRWIRVNGLKATAIGSLIVLER